MKLNLFGRADVALDATIIYQDNTHILFKTSKDEVNEKVDEIQHASSFKYNTLVGEIYDLDIKTKSDFAIIGIGFE